MAGFVSDSLTSSCEKSQAFEHCQSLASVQQCFHPVLEEM